MSADRTQPDADRQACTPCRGTGRVISNLGGEQREITCPWCQGSGKFMPGHDAQDDAPARDATGSGGESGKPANSTNVQET